MTENISIIYAELNKCWSSQPADGDLFAGYVNQDCIGRYLVLDSTGTNLFVVTGSHKDSFA